MGYSQQQLASYQMASSTLQKTRQLVMLYDAVLRFLKQAKLAMEEGRFEERLHLIQKASNIIMGLHNAVDFEKGGEISQILSNFYMAIDLRMINLNRTNSASECDQIIREVKIMRDAWEQVDQQYSAPVTASVEETAKTPETVSADFSA